MATYTPSGRKRGRPRKEDVAAQLGKKVSQLPDGAVDEEGLTPRQRRVLEVIREFLIKFGYPPSVREIAVLSALGSPLCTNSRRCSEGLLYAIESARAGGSTA